MLKSDPARKVFIFALLIILVLAATIATRNGIAYLSAYSPRQHLEYWQKSAKTPPQDKLAAELASIRSAIEWQKNRAEYRDIEALLLYYQALHHYQTGSPEGFRDTTLEAIAG